ncbi:MAG: hypothetical protein WCO94_11885 [Verrucomicrobiota bacterium]
MNITLEEAAATRSPSFELVSLADSDYAMSRNNLIGDEVYSVGADNQIEGDFMMSVTSLVSTVGESAPIVWDTTTAQRFTDLGMKIAYKEATSAERQELSRLQVARRQRFYPRTAQELIQDFEQRKAVESLKEALKACISAYAR